jgi:hypothetical protein
MSKITEFLVHRFPQNKVAPGYFGELLSAYEASGLAPPHLVAEVTSGDDGKLLSCVWEAHLHRHLLACGFEFCRDRVGKSGQKGPDFGIIYDGKTVWIEAVCPAPEGIPQRWLDPPKSGEFQVKTMPHEQMLLRWTAAVKDKRDKLRLYAESGVIPATDSAVIAVNGCRLQTSFLTITVLANCRSRLRQFFPLAR